MMQTVTPISRTPPGIHPESDESIRSALARLIHRIGYDTFETYLVEEDRASARLINNLSMRTVSRQDVESVSLSDPNSISKTINQNYPQIEAINPETREFSFGAQPEAWAQTVICLPIILFNQTRGVLAVYSNSAAANVYQDMDALQGCAVFAGCASAVSSLVQSGPGSDQVYDLISQAAHDISEVDTAEEILEITVAALKQSPYVLIHLAQENERIALISIHDPVNQEDSPGPAEDSNYLTIMGSEIEGFLADPSPRIINVDDPASMLPGEISSLLRALDIRSASFLPIWDRSTITHLFIIGSRANEGISTRSIQPYTILIGYAATSIEKIHALHHLQRRISALQSIASVSQAISMVTDLNELYETIHEKITQVMGEIDLIIAIYHRETDMISIPYAHESGQNIPVEPFPLGQGLTSILIRTQQPLMLVEDTERRAMELGAKVAGSSAKSWLGVPLIVSSEVIGAIIVQDIDREHRFDNDDLRLLTTLSSQVAITIRNVRLLEEAKRRADRERKISEISRRIWASPDIETIASTTILELGRTLKASQATFHLKPSAADSDAASSSEIKR